MTEEELLKIYGTKSREYNIKPPFFISSNDVYRDRVLWNIMRGKTELYFYLRTWIIRGRMKYNDKLHLYQNYYKNGKLASARSIEKLAVDLKQGTRRIGKDLKMMEYFGIIDVDFVEPADAWDNRPHYIYTFGEHNKKKGKLNEEIYYIDIIL